jgi:uncharacterized protein YhbP (UPF0306 family)
MDLNTLLKEYLTKNKVMQLATINNGQPWLCNVYYVADGNNIYWTSAKNRRHSLEIHKNPKVAATIVHDPDKKQAIQITGEASEVSLDDAERVDKLYGDKYGHKSSRLEEVKADTPASRAYWILKPRTISFWDEVNFPDSPKQELPLN